MEAPQLASGALCQGISAAYRFAGRQSTHAGNTPSFLGPDLCKIDTILKLKENTSACRTFLSKSYPLACVLFMCSADASDGG